MRQIKILPTITDRKGDSLERYLQDISHIEMITPEEEVELARRIKKGDNEALEKLVCANLRFVVSVAKQYQGQGIGLIDLVNEGNVGLMTAAQKFDESRGFKFISYAVWWIRQSIMQALADNSRMVRLPQNQVGQLSKVMRYYYDFVQAHERRPSIDEISEGMDMAPEKVKTALRAYNKHVSTDAPLSDDDNSSMIDLLQGEIGLSTDGQMTQESLRFELKQVLVTLPERERQVVSLFFGIDEREYSLEEIGERLKLSKERVRQIKEKAITALRNRPECRNLRTFLG